MPHTLIAVPCTVRALEAALHNYCDHHGAWDAEVHVRHHEPQGFYTVELVDPEKMKGESR